MSPLQASCCYKLDKMHPHRACIVQAANLANFFIQEDFGIGAARGQYFNDVIGIGNANLINQAFLADDPNVPLLPHPGVAARPAGNILFSVLVSSLA